MSAKITLRLVKPVEAHGETIGTLELREPTGRDIARCGFPFQVGSGGATGRGSVDAAVISEYISELGGVPRSTVDLMAPIDWCRAMGEIVGFFGDSEPQAVPPTAPSGS